MIEIKTKLFTQRIYATQLSKDDWYKPVIYHSYRGDVKKIPFYYYKNLQSHTCITDMSVPMEEILASMQKSLRQEIRKGERIGCVFEWGYFYDEFVDFYNRFAECKGIDTRVTIDRIKRFGKPIVTKVSYQGQVMAMHVRAIDKDAKFVCALYTSNARFFEGVDKRIASTANKYLQYKDMELIQSWGVETYDWAGVDINKDHEKRYSIGEYKLAYGGKVAPSPTLYSPLYAIMMLFRVIIVKLGLYGLFFKIFK